MIVPLGAVGVPAVDTRTQLVLWVWYGTNRSMPVCASQRPLIAARSHPQVRMAASNYHDVYSLRIASFVQSTLSVLRSCMIYGLCIHWEHQHRPLAFNGASMRPMVTLLRKASITFKSLCGHSEPASSLKYVPHVEQYWLPRQYCSFAKF